MTTIERRYTRQSLASVIGEAAIIKAQSEVTAASTSFHNPRRRFSRTSYEDNFKIATEYIKKYSSHLILKLIVLELTLKTASVDSLSEPIDLEQKRLIPKISVKPVDIHEGTYLDAEKNGHIAAIDQLLLVLSTPEVPLQRYSKPEAEQLFDLFIANQATHFLLPTRIPQVDLKSSFPFGNNQPRLSLIISPEK